MTLLMLPMLAYLMFFLLELELVLSPVLV